MDEVLRFDEWMFKIKNKYYFDNDRMLLGYQKIIEHQKELSDDKRA